uniref:Uncharacterized protein n=1 Tax=Ciona savignyi TaxID=51511 RepID=H2YI21_CIOSA
HSVVSKSPAPPQTFLRPVQVLPAQQSVRSHSSHVISQPTPGSPPAQTQISKFSIVPRQQPRIYVVDDDTVTSPHHDITQRVSPVRSPSPIVSTSLNINVNTSPPSPTSSTLHPHGRPTSPKVSPPCPSPSRVTSPLPLDINTMSTSYPDSNNSDENHNFKAEKDQLVQQVSQTVTSPTPKQTKQRNTSSREFAIIQRDIEHRQAMMSSTTTPMAHLQEYKVSNFEQRLMNEIEYRLERSPPVVEDPADGVYEDV